MKSRGYEDGRQRLPCRRPLRPLQMVITQSSKKRRVMKRGDNALTMSSTPGEFYRLHMHTHFPCFYCLITKAFNRNMLLFGFLFSIFSSSRIIGLLLMIISVNQPQRTANQFYEIGMEQWKMLINFEATFQVLMKCL